eukprot:Hpha_TRINITY_DN26960_c0_g1::TRINITY_DN26960_c0_g1_i1::g.24823::m.24823
MSPWTATPAIPSNGPEASRAATELGYMALSTADVIFTKCTLPGSTHRIPSARKRKSAPLPAMAAAELVVLPCWESNTTGAAATYLEGAWEGSCPGGTEG